MADPEDLGELLRESAQRDFQYNRDATIGIEEINEGLDYQFDPAKSLYEHQIEHLKLQLDEARDTQNLRKKYLPRIYWLILVWLATIVVFTVLSGYKIKEFELDDNVLIALVTSTTIGVLGLFGIAAKWLFPQSK